MFLEVRHATLLVLLKKSIWCFKICREHCHRAVWIWEHAAVFVFIANEAFCCSLPATHPHWYIHITLQHRTAQPNPVQHNAIKTSHCNKMQPSPTQPSSALYYTITTHPNPTQLNNGSHHQNSPTHPNPTQFNNVSHHNTTQPNPVNTA